MADYGLIGEKLSHSYSADIHRLLGYEYDMIEIAQDQLHNALHSGYKGYNVTVPYKEKVIPLLDSIDPVVTRIGACNTVVRKDGKLYGYNTDYYGLKTIIAELAIDMHGATAIILGSGGTSKTAQCVLEDMGARCVKVSRSGDINYQNIYDIALDAKLIVNTTPYGMYPNYQSEPLVDIEKFSRLEGVADVVFNPIHTAILQRARALGLKTVGGLKMLVCQAIKASEYWQDSTLDVDADKIVEAITHQMLNITLIGMPGSGKSLCGEYLQKLLGREMVDTDIRIEQQENSSCQEIISNKGEEYFRKVESQVLLDAQRRKGVVVSTGGGSVKLAKNRYYIACNSIVVYIRRPLDKLCREGRPLSKDEQALYNLYQERAPLYEQLADITIDNDGDIGQLLERLQSVAGQFVQRHKE